MREVSYFVFPKSVMYQLALLRICFYITLNFCTLLECQRLNTTFLLPVFFPGGDFNSKVAKSSAKNTKNFSFVGFSVLASINCDTGWKKIPSVSREEIFNGNPKRKEKMVSFPMDGFWSLLTCGGRCWGSLKVGVSSWATDPLKKHIRMSILMWMPMKFMEIHWFVKKYNVRIVLNHSTSATDLEEKGQMELYVLKQQNENGSQPIYVLVNIIGHWKRCCGFPWVEWFLMSFKFSFRWFLRHGVRVIIFDVHWNGMKLLRCALCKSAPFSDRRVGQDLGELDLLLQIFWAGYFCNLTREPFFWYIQFCIRYIFSL